MPHFLGFITYERGPYIDLVPGLALPFSWLLPFLKLTILSWQKGTLVQEGMEEMKEVSCPSFSSWISDSEVSNNRTSHYKVHCHRRLGRVPLVTD